MLATLRRYALVLFFVLAYTFTWARWLPEAAAGRGWIEFQTPFWLMLLGGYGPLLSAVLLTALLSGKVGLRELAARLVRWRVSLRWYLVVLLAPLFFQLVGLFLYSLLSARPLTLAPNPLPWLELLSFFPLFLLGFDGLGEEVGWRGFALPQLLTRASPLVSSLVLGVLWGAWHFAYALAPASFLSNTPFYLVIANTVVLSIFHTWIFAHVRGSIFIAILFHAWNNTLTMILTNWLPVYREPGTNLSILLVQVLLAAAVVAFARPFQLWRGEIPGQDAHNKI